MTFLLVLQQDTVRIDQDSRTHELNLSQSTDVDELKKGIACVSGTIRLGKNRAGSIQVDLYLRDGFYTVFYSKKGVPTSTIGTWNLSLSDSKNVSKAGKFECVSKPKIIETPFGDFAIRTGLIELTAEIEVSPDTNLDDLLIFGIINIPICNQNTSVMVKKRFAAFVEK